MRMRCIIMFVVGAVPLAALLAFRLPLGIPGLGLIMLIGLAVQGAWSDHQKAERMSGIYTHQRSGSGKPGGKYHRL
jgi:hypothetical protein